MHGPARTRRIGNRSRTCGSLSNEGSQVCRNANTLCGRTLGDKRGASRRPWMPWDAVTTRSLCFRFAFSLDKLRPMVRRIVALALSAVMLHLNVERADVACATHVDGAANTEQTHHSVQSHHATSAHHTTSAHHAPAAEHAISADHQQCQIPAQPDCCLALVSCSIVTDMGTESGNSREALFGSRAVAFAQSAPTSRNTAPEPPPPRA
jgi:hypothetical protein